MRMTKSYSELIRIPSFEERYRYLKLSGRVGESTFGYQRYLNQLLYTSKRWKTIRDIVIIRDNGCDLAIPDYEIHSGILIHHINPITIADVRCDASIVFDTNNLITTTKRTHDAIHYGSEDLLPKPPIQRTKNDTIPWR